MIAAIYSRKSKFTGKGESTQNQIDICKEYANNHFDIDDFFVYEDEGFSGGTLVRPQYQRMIKDANYKKFDILICYRLDRISRNISDFANLIVDLKEKSISFVSVRESFDTTTPMGRAMMYIASVFAQLERETIAERIKDNMHHLARSGRWLGGNTPTGYESEPIVYLDSNMKQKKMYKLTPIKKELDTVKTLFDKYLEFKSLQKVETYCLQNEMKTKQGNDFHKNTIKMILTNPVYSIADNYIYDYFKINNAEICSEKEKFNGKYGIIGYNKKVIKNNRFIKFNDIDKWIIAIGRHKGILSGKDWVKVQKTFEKNRNKFPRKGTSHSALLSGLLTCANCGSFMRVTYGPKIKGTDKYYHYYECNLRFNSKRKRCNNKRLSAREVDEMVIEEIKNIISPRMLGRIDDIKSTITDKSMENKKSIDIIISNTRSIESLVKQLSNSSDDIAPYLLNEINKLHEKNKNLEVKITDKDRPLEGLDIDLLSTSVIDFNKKVMNADFKERKTLLNTIVESIDWDGENLDIKLFKDIDINM